MLTQNLAEYWENLYRDGKDYWSLNKITPAFIKFLDQRKYLKGERVLVPGAGKGHDAAEWANRGYETLAVDFSQSAYESLSKYSRKYPKLSVLKLDLFDLTPKSTDLFDIIYEYTCFCAIHPGRRDEYFETWHKMLKPDGVVIALFYPIISKTSLDGPPHPTSENELQARLDGVFNIVDQIEAVNSVDSRHGKEKFWILKKA